MLVAECEVAQIFLVAILLCYYLINGTLPCHIALHARSNTAAVLGTLPLPVSSNLAFFSPLQSLESGAAILFLNLTSTHI
jgi:hypothetical protein